jgi:hypothetical protein
VTSTSSTTPNPALRDEQSYSPAHFKVVCDRFGDPAALDRYDTGAAVLRLVQGPARGTVGKDRQADRRREPLEVDRCGGEEGADEVERYPVQVGPEVEVAGDGLATLVDADRLRQAVSRCARSAGKRFLTVAAASPVRSSCRAGDGFAQVRGPGWRVSGRVEERRRRRPRLGESASN